MGIEDQTNSIQQRGGDPTHEQVFDVMDPCVPYTTGEISDVFDDVTRWTIERRLDDLYGDGRINKKKHAPNRVAWYITPESECCPECGCANMILLAGPPESEE